MEQTRSNNKSFGLLLQIIKFAIPLLLTGYLQLLYSAADLVVVGKFAGEAADSSIAAVGANSSLISLIFNLFFGLSIGANIVMANAFGAKDIEKGQRTLHSSIIISLICGSFIGIIGIIMAPQFLRWTNCDEEVLDLAVLYLRIYLIGAPANIFYNFAQANLRAIGDTKTPLIILLIAGIINFLLNLLFVVCFHMNVNGVGLATIISQYFSAIVVLIILIRTKNEYCHFSLKKLKLSKKESLEISLHGLPAGIQGSIFSLSNVIIQSAINSFGKYVMAGKAAAFSIDNFVYTAMNTFYTACIVYTGQAYGEKNISKMKRVFWICNFCVIYVSILFGGLIIIFSDQLLMLYTSSKEAIDAGRKIMMTVLPLYFLCGLNEVACAELRSLKHPFIPTIVSLVTICGFRIIYVYAIFPLHRDVQFLYLSYIISWTLAFTIHFGLYYILRKKSYQKCLGVK